MTSRSPAPARLPAIVRIACLGVALAALVACSEGARTERAVPRPNVLLLTIDTLRADYIHAYGFPHPTTPGIDALAARGLLFENAIAAATVTAPAHASIMTGRYVRQHSIGTLNGETRLEGGVTLAERFREAGYRTAAFVSNVVLRRRSGLARGFEVYDDALTQGEVNRKAYFERIAEDTARLAADWIDQQAGGEPFFLWVHLQDPHGPYTPPDGYRGRTGEVKLRMNRPLKVLRENFGLAGIPAYQRLDDLRHPGVYAGLYADELLYTDEWVGRLVARAEAVDTERGLVTLLTSDHGESMGEQGYFFQHGQATTPDLARVPFILVADGVAPGRSEVPVSHVDVAPTLLALAGLEVLPDSSGVDVRAFSDGSAGPTPRPIFCDTDGEAGVYVGDRFTRAGGPLASAREPLPGAHMQYETQQVTADRSLRPLPLDATARGLLDAYMRDRAELVLAEAMTEENIEQLRALGYLPPLDADEAGAPLEAEAD